MPFCTMLRHYHISKWLSLLFLTAATHKSGATSESSTDLYQLRDEIHHAQQAHRAAIILLLLRHFEQLQPPAYQRAD